jgi:glycosyltransferase involved in cell wall biosynthesis
LGRPPTAEELQTALKYAFAAPGERIGAVDSRPGEHRIIQLATPLDDSEPEQARARLEQAAAVAGESVVALAQLYPASLLAGGGPMRTLEPLRWWAGLLQGFELLEPPRERPGGRTVLIYRRRGAEPRPPAISLGSLDAVLLLPAIRNSFSEAFESLARAACSEGLSAAVADPEQARQDPRLRQAPVKITWAHYWPRYREIEVAGAGRRLENFVGNFQMEPRGRLTPWLEEMLAREIPKLTPSQFGRELLQALGVAAESIHVVPHGYSEEMADPPAAPALATRKSFRFLAVVNSHDPRRFGTDILLEAYRRAFRREDDVCLVLKDYGGDPGATLERIAAGRGAEILYYAHFVSKRELAAFYSACQAFVSPFRGEGFGMKILDAAAVGLPLILPLFGGPRDYADQSLVEAVRYRRAEVGDCLETREIDWRERLRWAEPDVDDLARAMRSVYDGYDAARGKALELSARVLQDWSWPMAARKLIRALEQ